MTPTLNQTPPKQKTGLAIKLLARLCDPSCQRGEAENAALKLVHVVKTNEIRIDDIGAGLAEDQLALREPEQQEPAAVHIELNFGKYDGYTLGYLARHDPQYLTWAMENLTRKPELRRAIRTVACFYGLLAESEAA